MSERLRVAVIGAGGWGWQHAPAFSERQDVQLCAIVGRTEERTRARAEEFGVPYYLSLAKMLEEVQPKLVSICLPNKEHFQATLEVIRAGVPLLAEKPLAFDPQEADALLAEAEQRGLFFAINFNHRYARPVQMAWRAIQEGRLGQLVFATWRFGGEGGDCREHENLIETQCHGFDMLEYLCGPIDSVMAQMTDATGKGWSTLSLALHFAKGAVGSLVGSYDSSYAYPDTHRLEVNGTEGHLTVDDTVRRYSFQAAGSEVGEGWQAGYFNDIDREFKRTFDRYLEALLAAFRAGEGPPVHARTGRRALLLAQAAIRSFETGARVPVK
ncbi:MAG: Gfo/Idh/MocA family oxidoreductase [Armatimonadetes bacterium]|nr:Gfo/Idh/MocA family oxidoreductase [Armatimonadota bacterium]